MSDAKDVKFALKVMINKEKTKVLFAEASNDFTDVLLSFLAMPLGRIMKVLENHYGEKSPVVGSLTTLYNGLANLDNVHFSTETAKVMLLNPKGSLDSECRKLKLDVSGSQPTKYFICGPYWCGHPKHENVCMYYGTGRCACGRALNTDVNIQSQSQPAADDGGVFTINTASFVILDDLRIVPYSIGFFQTLSNLEYIDGIDGAELRNLTFGTDEIMDLLRCSLLSKTPLTDLILKDRQMGSAAAKTEPGFLSHQIRKEETSSSKKIMLKVMVQKSTNKLLFAEAEEDFIELLFSFLLIPIGVVESLLGGNTSLKNIDNLYRSVADVIDDKYFITPDTKNRLLNPKLPHCYISKDWLLPLDQESAPALYYRPPGSSWDPAAFSHSQLPGYDLLVSSFKSPKGQGNYVKAPATYLVTDDLTVAPFCMSSSLSILNRLDIPLSDVDELGMQIGLEEALSTLKASLTSTSALSNGLISRVMKKQPKQEHWA